MKEQTSPVRVQGQYGKDGIELVQWDQAGRARSLDVAIRISGPGITPSYLIGDNSGLLTSDAIRAHLIKAYAAATDTPLAQATEQAAHALTLLDVDLDRVSVSVRARTWDPIEGVYQPRTWVDTALLECTRHGGTWQQESAAQGFAELALLSPGGSSFTGFKRDSLLQQADIADRPMNGRLTAEWSLKGSGIALENSAVVHTVRTAVGTTASNSFQHLLHCVGSIVLATHEQLDVIRLRFDSSPLTPHSPGTFEIRDRGTGITEATVRRP